MGATNTDEIISWVGPCRHTSRRRRGWLSAAALGREQAYGYGWTVVAQAAARRRR
jgi:hypothetical protein